MATLSVTEVESGVQTEAVSKATQHVSDRRRAGRIANASPELIKLFRAPAAENVALGSEAPSEEAEYDDPATIDADPLRAVRGIGFAIILSLGCWAIMGVTIWLVLRA